MGGPRRQPARCDHRPIRTPIILANSYALPDDPATLDESDPDALVYTRESGANQLGLQTKLAALEHGEAAAVFGTGRRPCTPPSSRC